MAKSVVNLEFVAVANSQFAKAGFARRAKGQRRMADGLPFFLFSQELPAGFSVELLGVGPGYSDSGAVISYDHLVVTTPQGRFPASRRTSPGDSFNISQEFNYVRA